MRARPLGTYVSWVLGTFLLLSLDASAAGNGSRLVAQNSPEPSNLVIPKAASDSEKLSDGRAAIAEIEGSLKTLNERIEDARRDKNMCLLNQLNDSARSINALLKVAETSLILLEDAISQNNALQAEHQYRKISIARGKARQIVRNTQDSPCDEEQGNEGGASDEPQIDVDDAALEEGELGSDPEVNDGGTVPQPPYSPPAS